MRIILCPSALSHSTGARQQFLTTFLINETVALDAGSLGLYATPLEQARVKHLLLSHSHIDHLATLPLFVTNTYRGDGNCVTVYGSAAVLDCLRRDLFNDRLWPDFFRLSQDRPPYLRVQELHPGRSVECDGLRITPVPVDHIVPTLGFVIEDREAAVVFTSDTGPTEALWEQANRTPNLKAVFVEVTFPNARGELAAVAKHLTAELFGQEARKLKQPVRFFAVHLNAGDRQQVIKELKALQLPELEVARFGFPYVF